MFDFLDSNGDDVLNSADDDVNEIVANGVDSLQLPPFTNGFVHAIVVINHTELDANDFNDSVDSVPGPNLGLLEQIASIVSPPPP